MSKNNSDSKIFYGWWIVAAAFIVMAFAHGIVFNCNGQFIKPVCEDMGYSRQQFSINQTILSCATMVMALISGKIYNKFNVQKTMCVFSIALVAGYTGYSLCTSLPMFYVLSAVVGFSIGGMTMIPLSLIVSNWFHEKRGLAIGIAFMGSGVGGMVLQPITASIVQAMGWRTAYQCLGVLMFCTIVPCSFFVLKRSPADVGLKPLGDGVEIKTGGVGEGKMLSEIITTPRFWVFAICAMGTAMATSGLMQNINPHLTDSGYSVAVAATITSCCMGALAVGKMLLGQIFDKMGTRSAIVIACGCIMLGLFGLVAVKFAPAILLVVVGSGLGCAFGTVAYPILTTSMFGSKDYSNIYGIISVMTSLGQAISPFMLNTVYDMKGSYSPAYIICIAIAAVSCVVFLSVTPKQEKNSNATA